MSERRSGRKLPERLPPHAPSGNTCTNNPSFGHPRDFEGGRTTKCANGITVKSRGKGSFPSLGAQWSDLSLFSLEKTYDKEATKTRKIKITK